LTEKYFLLIKFSNNKQKKNLENDFSLNKPRLLFLIRIKTNETTYQFHGPIIKGERDKNGRP